MMDHPLLEAVNLSKRYEDGALAVNDVTFSVPPGGIFAMLGGNGAGKTTTINIFLNFLEPTSGEARINGIPTHIEPLKAKQHVAFVSENVMLYTNFTALQNLDYFARLGGKTHYTKDDYRSVLLRVGLQEEAHNRKLRGFSSKLRHRSGNTERCAGDFAGRADLRTRSEIRFRIHGTARLPAG